MINTLSAAAKAMRIRGYGSSGYLAKDKNSQNLNNEQQLPKDDEIKLEVWYCGECNAEAHTTEKTRNQQGYHFVPGHYIIGKIASTGRNSGKFKPGDAVVFSGMLDSCKYCKSFLPQEFEYHTYPVATSCYKRYRTASGMDLNSFEGFPDHVIANKKFAIPLPKDMDKATAAAIVCAGVPAYLPLKKWAISSGKKVGIIGNGQLAHVAVMVAKAMGANVTIISTQENNHLCALGCGADDVLVSTDKESMLLQVLSFDFLLSTLTGCLDVKCYVRLLGVNGTLASLDLLVPHTQHGDHTKHAIPKQMVSGWYEHRVSEMQEAINFFTLHNIVPKLTIETEEANRIFVRRKENNLTDLHAASFTC